MTTCSNEEIHVNDIGTIFKINLTDCGEAVDLTGYLSLKMHFEKPDGTSLEKTATISGGDATAGIIQYITVDGDLDTPGTWKVQAEVTIPTGTWSSSTSKFKVYANLH